MLKSTRELTAARISGARDGKMEKAVAHSIYMEFVAATPGWRVVLMALGGVEAANLICREPDLIEPQPSRPYPVKNPFSRCAEITSS